VGCYFLLKGILNDKEVNVGWLWMELGSDCNWYFLMKSCNDCIFRLSKILKE